jgi:TonB family protein
LGGIFVSYRRSDSQGEAGRLFDDLSKHFGEDRVFMDVAAIEAGRDFRKAIEEGVSKCGVLLVVIGPEWVDAKDERGARRLNDPSDFVRIETASALKRDIPVIPVLVRGAKMPSAERLPEELKELAYRNCIELTHARWRSDIQLLVEALRRLLGDSNKVKTGSGSSEVPHTTQAASAQRAGRGTSQIDEGSSPRLDSAILQRVSRELALRIGPIATIVVTRAAAQCSSVEGLYLKVAEEIDSREEREKFLREGVESASILPAKSVQAKTPTSLSAEAPRVVPPSQDNGAPAKPSSPPARAPSTNRAKYFLFVGVGAAFLLGIFFFARRSARPKEPSVSGSIQTSTRESQVVEPSAVKTSPAPPVEEPQPKTEGPVQGPATPASRASDSSRRTRVSVPGEVSKNLLISSVPPVYPLLARQAHIQGMVILDADISKNGTVESLKVVHGHPLLVQSALEAAKQWRYKPYLQDGLPVPFSTQIAVGFTIQ